MNHITVQTARVKPQWEAKAKPVNLMSGQHEDALRRAMMATHRPKVGEGEYRMRSPSGGTSKKDEAKRDRARRWRKTLERLDVMHPHMTKPMTAHKISEVCGLPLGATSGTLKALHKRKMVAKVGTVLNGSGNPIFLWVLVHDWFGKVGADE